MSPRLLADADLNHKIVAGLRRREPSVTFISAIEGGIIGEPDPIVLGMAASLECVLVSHDRKTMPSHFAKYINSHPSPGLIIVSQDLDVGTAI